MAYTPINFKNKKSGGTPVSAANLNHMEDGIVQAHNLVPTESGSVGQVLTKTQNGTSWQDADNLPDGGTEGQVLTRTANNGAEWTDAGNPTASQVAEATGDWLDEHITEIPATAPIVDTSLLVSGAAADSAKVGTEITALRNAIAQGSGLTNEAKTALLELLQHVAYVDDDGQDYYDALETALNPPTNLSYISAVYTQGSTIVYDTDSLNSLRSSLVVTAHYDDLTTETVTSYTLSGTLTAGTSTITVTYSGKTTTFTVVVTAYWDVNWDYSMGSPLDYGFYRSSSTTGTAVMQSDGYLLTNDSNDADNFFRHTGWENNVAPTSGDIEIVFTLPTMPTLSMGFLLGVPAFQTSIWSNALYENHLHSTQNTGNATVISGVTVNASTEYKLRFKYTPTLAEVYWNDNLVYTFSGSRANTRKNILINAQNNNMALLVKAIRFKDLSEPSAEVTSISAVFNQVGVTVYETDSLDSLKDHLTVTANYSDSTSAVVTNYTLSGTLTAGTSTITVSYGGKTATFSVTVTEQTVNTWYYPFNGSLVSSGTKDFGWQGAQNYSTGADGSGQSYWHKVTTEGDNTTDAGPIYANSLTDVPDLSGDFTIAVWFKGFTELRGQLFSPFEILNDETNLPNTNFSSPTNVKNGYAVTAANLKKQVAGCRIWMYSGTSLQLRLINSALTAGRTYTINSFPSGFTTTAWHHYAVTRSGSTIRFFIDGQVIYTVTCSESLCFASQVSIGGYYADPGQTVPAGNSYGNCFDDLYIAESCKWTADFDPTTIVY